MITASCHCGAVRIEISRKPARLSSCNCSICRRYGALWAYYSKKTAKVIKKTGATTAYRWFDKVIDFHHCNTCGCLTHYTGRHDVNRDRVAVNARMLPPETITGIRIRHFDGADTWKYLD